MPPGISNRLLELINALPLKDGMRVLEIGCGTGSAARDIATRIRNGKVLGIDRSKKAIEKAIDSSRNEIKNGSLEFRVAKIEEFELEKDDQLFDIAFAIRVGALDGRHPEIEKQALTQIRKALRKNGLLFIDSENSFRKKDLSKIGVR